MAKKTIKASDVLGDNYYIYELTSSNYTPTLNGTITITCTMKDVYGTAASGKSITLYQNGTSKGAQTTNSSGVATWSITCSSAGLQKFNIKDTSIEVFVDDKAVSSHQHGNITSDGKLTTSHNGTYSTFVGVQDSTGTLYKASKINSDIIIDGTAHANIGSNANDNQSAINTAINTALGNKANSTHSHSEYEDYGTFAELQTIINNAQSGDTIILDKNYKNDGSSIVDGIGIEIHKDLTIIGNGHIIDGNHLSSIFSTDYTTLTFENITLMNGNGLIDDANGGALYGDGGALYGNNLNLINCNFINNVSAYVGGAINGNGDIYIAGCNFINNSVDNGDGGAISCFSNNMTVTNSTFINNNANGKGGAISLSVYNNSLFNISDCVFIDNVATNNGGGIFAYIGSTSGENLKVYNCTFENSTLYNTTNVDYLTSHQDITEKEDTTNKVTSLSENSTNTQYPSAKTVYDGYMNTKTVTPEMSPYGNTYTLNGVTKSFYHTGIDSEDLGYYDKIIYTITFNDNTFQMCNQTVPSMGGGVVVDTIYFDGSDCYWGGEWDDANQEYAKGNLICEGNILQATLQGGVITINGVETNWEANGEIRIFGNAIFSYTVYSYKYISTDYLNVYSNDTFSSYEQGEQSMNGETKMRWEHDFHSYRIPRNLSKVIYTITFNDNTFSYANPFKTIYFDGTDCYEGEWDYDDDENGILVKGNLICEGNELQILYQDKEMYFPDGSSYYSNDLLTYLYSFGEVVVKAQYIAPRFEYAQNKIQSLSSSYYDESIVYPSVSAVKNYAENKSNKTSSWNSTTDNTRYPTEKLVKDSLDGKEDKTNKVTSISSSSTNTQYPSAKCVYDIFTNTSPILCNLLSNVISYGENNDPDW